MGQDEQMIFESTVKTIKQIHKTIFKLYFNKPTSHLYCTNKFPNIEMIKNFQQCKSIWKILKNTQKSKLNLKKFIRMKQEEEIKLIQEMPE